jgi:hypothetical protein
VKNHAYSVIAESLPVHMKKPMLDSDGDPVLDEAGQPKLVVKDKHRPQFNHLGGGRYEFIVMGIDEATRTAAAAKLAAQFGGAVVLLNPSCGTSQ